MFCHPECAKFQEILFARNGSKFVYRILPKDDKRANACEDIPNESGKI